MTIPFNNDVVNEGKGHTIRFVLWPRLWASYKPLLPSTLCWQTEKLTATNIYKLPHERGVYVFFIKPMIEDLDASYLFYIGETERPLQERIGEYLNEMKKDRGRPLVVDFLNRYINYVWVSCAPIANKSIKTADVEDELQGAFLPIANPKYPAKVTKIAKAIFHS
jgi:Uri superfamily endonuclease